MNAPTARHLIQDFTMKVPLHAGFGGTPTTRIRPAMNPALHRYHAKSYFLGKTFQKPPASQSLSKTPRSETPTGGVLSEGVLAAVEGPSLAVDEFQQLHRSPNSKQDLSTAASTPPLRRFLPQQISLARAAVLILRAGVWEQQPPYLRFPLFPKPNRRTNSSAHRFQSRIQVHRMICLRLRRAKAYLRTGVWNTIQVLNSPQRQG